MEADVVVGDDDEDYVIEDGDIGNEEDENPLIDYIENGNYEEKTFEELLQKQNTSVHGDSLSQLGQRHGFGIILRVKIEDCIQSPGLFRISTRGFLLRNNR